MLERIRNVSWEAVLGVLAVAGAFLAVPLAKSDLAKVVQLPGRLYSGVAVAGVALAFVGLSGVVLLVLRLALSRPAVWSEFRPVSRRNVQAVYELMNRVFGDETPSVTRMLEWQRCNKTALTAVYAKELSDGRTKEKLVGVFKLLPLTANAVELFELEKKTGATLAANHIAKTGEVPAGLYIGDVLATTGRSKADVLRRLKAMVASQPKAALPIYTRPLTSDGARLVKKYNFVPVTVGLTPGSAGRIHKFSS